MTASKIKTLLLALFISMFAFSLIAFPKISLEASIRGLNMWWEIVFPSLLPFFILSEMMIGLGVVNFIGVLLEPLMRPLFKVPGAGGFVWAMAMASGFPSGAKLAARLRLNGELTQTEAERLVCFTNSSNPLFIFGAVSVGFFYNPHLGILLAIAHYTGNLFVGLTMRFYGNDKKNKTDYTPPFSFYNAFSAMHQARLKDRRPLGQLMGDSVLSSVQTLLMIGGFIILFSVINKLLFHLHITSLLATGAAKGFQWLQLPSELTVPFIAGIFEITLGSQMISQVQESTLLQQAIVTSFVLAFSGLSVQAQVASILATSDIRFHPFFFARILHGFYSASIAFILWQPVYEHSVKNSGLLHSLPVINLQHSPMNEMIILLKQYGPLITIMMLTIYTLLYISTKKQ
ncbi:sporulation integral membrane protein YlbJ [Bacillus sp. FJAT-52991]|uniref:Sporulation integral membrane protein YlbJ n=1 Tax=Bacillus kandeliae TaxID=3129297 RepID=A0ABZ2NAF0_9BACI